MTTRIRADLTQRALVTPEDYRWDSSPIEGITRMKLDRIGDEIARATSLVDYEPHHTFPRHQHEGGEEILVLKGVFEDETGSYPAGTYLRNPIGTSHQPSSGPEGTRIFVKLHQFQSTDRTSVRINTAHAVWHPGRVPGLSVLPLHEHGSEHIALVRWAPNTQFVSHTHFGGEEIFVIDGTFHDEYGRYPAGSWIRSPHLSRHTPFTESEGALIYVKTGHLVESGQHQ